MRLCLQESPQIYPEFGKNPFLSIESYADSVHKKSSQTYPRQELVKILTDYNEQIGNETESVAAIQELLHEDKFCVVTGQQAGFMTGPAYTILKAITCLQVAKEHNALPIFWLATEDHDIEEIDHANTIDEKANLKKNHITLARDGRSAEDLLLTEQNEETISQYLCKHGIELPASSDDTYCNVMARLLVKLFKGTGLLFIEPKSLRGLSKDFFLKEVVEHRQIKDLLSQATEELKEAGFRAPIRIFENETNLFLKNDNNIRSRISVTEEGFVSNYQRFSKQELISLIDSQPQLFSANVAARPLFQCKVFPTAAYVAGPTEIQYHRQLVKYFEYHGISLPWVVPRISLTFVTKQAQQYLDFIKLRPWDDIPKQWKKIYPDITTAIKKKEQKNDIKLFLENTDIPYNALHYLNNLLRPNQHLQERTLNWLWIQSQTNENLIQELLTKVSWNAPGHYYYNLSS